MPLCLLNYSQSNSNYYYLTFSIITLCTNLISRIILPLTNIICLCALDFAVEEEVRGAGLLLNTQWDAFDSVRNNLAPVQGVPGACQHDLGFLCWGTAIRESPSQLTVTEAGECTGIAPQLDYHTDTQSHVHIRSNIVDVNVNLHRNMLILGMRNTNII